MPATASDPGTAGRGEARRITVMRGNRVVSWIRGSGRVRGVRWTIRLRLTLIYGALFLASGAALLAVTYALVASAPPVVMTPDGAVTRDLPAGARPFMAGQGAEIRAAEHWLLLTRSGIALGIMAAISVALGWLMAGRALRPIRAMTEQARRISEHNLDRRLAVAGPNDELKDLGDTFDGLLSRLDAAFSAQKRFVANASHELRTPLTLQRTLIEVTLADSHAGPEALRNLCERILALSEGQERLIEELLTLASSQRGLRQREPTDLAAAVGTALRESGSEDPGRPAITADLHPAWTSGAARLIERLAANLIDNAVRHNIPGGWVRLYTGVRDGQPVIRVVNSGPTIPADRVGSLFQPFQRLHARSADSDRHGLGLSIVTAIVTAHNARITATPAHDGGLDVIVAFPPSGAPPGTRAAPAAAP